MIDTLTDDQHLHLTYMQMAVVYDVQCHDIVHVGNSKFAHYGTGQSVLIVLLKALIS